MTIAQEDWKRFSIETDHISISDVVSGETIELGRIKPGPWVMFVEYDRDHESIKKAFCAHENLAIDMLRSSNSKKGRPSRLCEIEREMVGRGVLSVCDKKKAPMLKDIEKVQKIVESSFDQSQGIPIAFSDGEASFVNMLGGAGRVKIVALENKKSGFEIDGIEIGVLE